MESLPVTFIIPSRERENMKRGLEVNIKKHFKYYEIIYVEQCNDKLFMKGQLFNIGVKFAQNEILILQDIDIRHFNEINILPSIYTDNRMFLPFTHISQLKAGRIIETHERLFSYGGCQLLTKTTYLEKNGYSNLYFGWGAEDNDFSSRFETVRLDNTIGHIYHGGLGYHKHKGTYYHDHNVKMLQTRHSRNIQDDGYNQTKAKFTVEKKGKVSTVKVTHISVTKDFKFKDMIL